MRIAIAQLNFTIGAFEANFAKVREAVAEARLLTELESDWEVAVVVAGCVNRLGHSAAKSTRCIKPMQSPKPPSSARPFSG